MSSSTLPLNARGNNSHSNRKQFLVVAFLEYTTQSCACIRNSTHPTPDKINIIVSRCHSPPGCLPLRHSESRKSSLFNFQIIYFVDWCSISWWKDEKLSACFFRSRLGLFLEAELCRSAGSQEVRLVYRLLISIKLTIIRKRDLICFVNICALRTTTMANDREQIILVPRTRLR